MIDVLLISAFLAIAIALILADLWPDIKEWTRSWKR